jgi:hypothetical protein
MFKSILIFFPTIFGTLTFAQSADTFKIVGVITSSFTGEPISNAYVNYTKKNAVLTDSFGRFKINGLQARQYILSFSAFGYDNKDTTVTIFDSEQAISWTIHTDNCVHYSKICALRDIKNGKPVLLLQSGIAPIAFSTDKYFIKKYQVELYDLGCDASERLDCIVAYNQIIFEYLDKKYKGKWRADVRKDIIGLKE